MDFSILYEQIITTFRDKLATSTFHVIYEPPDNTRSYDICIYDVAKTIRVSTIDQQLRDVHLVAHKLICDVLKNNNPYSRIILPQVTFRPKGDLLIITLIYTIYQPSSRKYTFIEYLTLMTYICR